MDKLKLFALAVGVSSVMCNVIILIFNESFVFELVRITPEGNQYIRFFEIAIGLFVIPILFKLIWDELNCEVLE